MTSKLLTKIGLFSVLIVAPLSIAQAGDTGTYLGGSVGMATIEANVGDIPDAPVFNEDDAAFKAFLGYNFGVAPIIDLGIEAAYVNLGKPSGDFDGNTVAFETSGFSVFGLVGVNMGPVALFGKVGYLFWDVEGFVDGVSELSDDGSDIGYGAGLRFNVGSIEIRGEYELFDIEDAEDVNMWSVGLAYHF